MPMHTTPTEVGIVFALAKEAAPLFTMPAIDERGWESLPVMMARGAADALHDYCEAARTVHADSHLSEVGKQAKLTPMSEAAVAAFARCAEAVAVEARAITKMEADLLAVPKLSPADAVAAAEDIEIRQWWRQLPAQDRAQVLKRLQDEPAGHERLIAAMLRQPIPIALDHEVSVMNEVWKDSARKRDPAKAIQIDDGRAWLDWSRRCFQHLGATTPRVAGIKRDSMLRYFVGADKPAAVEFFGFEAPEVERARLWIERDKRLAAAGRA